jgi:hypothetical protein
MSDQQALSMVKTLVRLDTCPDCDEDNHSTCSEGGGQQFSVIVGDRIISEGRRCACDCCPF